MSNRHTDKKGIAATLEALELSPSGYGGYPSKAAIRQAEANLNAFIAAYWAVRAAALAGYDAEVTLPAVEAADAALAKLRGEAS